MTDKIPCSVLVLTRNSEKNLARCLRNLTEFAEILVHDANSEDRTVEIAKSFGARILKQYDTDEKSVRVKDFTEMRLRQRAEAKYDWVLYVDSDEYLDDGLIPEIRAILETATLKTIVKFPRLPVIDGRVRTHGLWYPEIMPRIHNRTGGCTLKPGKVVHEKYVYDASFPIVITKHPLYFPLPDIADLRAKDDRYLTLESERIAKIGYPFSHWLRYILLKELFLIPWMAIRVLLYLPRYFSKDAVPFAHEWRYVGYHWRYSRAITGAMIEHLKTKRINHS